ncbi:hypothetical protein MKW98_000387 [Papaver atlanticum]|uniref:Complex III subunit 9 n=1 Tax=Papaver atlanticum TaxID=357466 RepID=A0AAD4S3K3_9MAGN|nr:hypothetical protein MKW98_000387 [Papaver atlanticum]KAI3863605.1 hypothetical protein MKX03_031656 [Papaver bracteatum]
MDTIFKKPAPKTGGFYESAYKLFMRRNSVYVTVIIIGAFAGERAVDYGVKTLWENNNKGKRYEDISVLGQRPVEE